MSFILLKFCQLIFAYNIMPQKLGLYTFADTILPFKVNYSAPCLNQDCACLPKSHLSIFWVFWSIIQARGHGPAVLDNDTSKHITKLFINNNISTKNLLTYTLNYALDIFFIRSKV